MRLIIVMLLLSCGTLVENETFVDAGGNVGGDGGSTGLFCANDDPCVCDPCTSTSQCMSGLTCQPGRRRGVDCADGRSVCTTGQ